MDNSFLSLRLPILFCYQGGTMTYKTKIGYACMNDDIYPKEYKTCRIANVTEEKLRELIEHNLKVLELALEYNIAHNNKMFRISSSLIPFGSSDVNTIDWLHDYKDDFDRMKALILDNGMRVSVHPGQYTVINALEERVIVDSIAELEYHAILLDALSGNRNHKMILHVGGIYGDKTAAMQRFIDVYRNRLSDRIKKYLVIENDDRLYTVEDVLEIATQIPVPVVFDNLHHDINPSLQDLEMHEIIRCVVSTWSEKESIPKMHYSQQALDKRPGAHSYTIDLELFESDYKKIYGLYPCDIMLEVKDKNRSFIKVNALLYPSQTVLEQEWARYKYWVMARSQHAYNDLRVLFKNAPVDPIEFYRCVDSLIEVEPAVSSHVNAFQHVWGYFKDVATDKEKQQFLKLIDSYKAETIKSGRIYTFLEKLSRAYGVTYLNESYFFPKK